MYAPKRHAVKSGTHPTAGAAGSVGTASPAGAASTVGTEHTQSRHRAGTAILQELLLLLSTRVAFANPSPGLEPVVMVIVVAYIVMALDSYGPM